MAENTIVKEQLTDSMIDAGAELTRKLDEIGLPVTASFWFFMPEVNEWRLFFASPDVGSLGPLKVYAKVNQAIEQLGPLGASVPLSAVGVLDSEAELVRRLKVAVRTGPGLSRLRFTKNVADGQFIDDALIYRAA
jgi:hypothetical protein